VRLQHREATVSLTLTDTPVGYAPPVGPSVKVAIFYNQRKDSQAANEEVLPRVIAGAVDRAERRFFESRGACHFFGWVEQHRVGELADIEPLHVAAYIAGLQASAAKPADNKCGKTGR
jgi:hypothetical protein